MGLSDILIGAGKGGLTGAGSGAMIGSSFPGYGTLIGGAIGFVVGAIGGGVAGNVEGNAKDDMVAKQNQAADAQGKASETSARNAAAAMFKQAAADPRATSATMFKKGELLRSANTNYASIRDNGNPFNAVDDKATKQFYGKANVSKAA